MKGPGVTPTPRGLGTLVGATIALVAGWLLGLPEARAVGVAAGAAVLVGYVFVVARGPGPSVTRVARPERVGLGDPCEVALIARNESQRSSPVTSITDEVAGEGHASVLLAPLLPGARTEATYSLSTERRGIRRIGPLRRDVEDAFGLVRRSEMSSEVTTVVVLPRIVRLDPLPAAVGDDPELGVHSMVSSSTVEEEFTGLRGYVAGDDVRRIHWPSTARAGTPVVRQFEVPWQHRTTVLMDVRGSHHDSGSFERAVTVAASVLVLAASAGELVRFATTVDPGPPFASAAEQLDGLLDRLAVIRPDSGPLEEADGLVAAVEQCTRSATGRLVICAGRLAGDELERVNDAAARAGLAVMVTTAPGSGRPVVDATGPVLIPWDGTADLATLWRAAGQRSQEMVPRARR